MGSSLKSQGKNRNNHVKARGQIAWMQMFLLALCASWLVHLRALPWHKPLPEPDSEIDTFQSTELPLTREWYSRCYKVFVFMIKRTFFCSWHLSISPHYGDSIWMSSQWCCFASRALLKSTDLLDWLESFYGKPFQNLDIVKNVKEILVSSVVISYKIFLLPNNNGCYQFMTWRGENLLRFFT